MKALNKRDFFKTLASGLVVFVSPQLFIPRLIKPVWKPLPYQLWGTFPVIANIDNIDFIESILAVQPLNGPSPDTLIFQLSYVNKRL